MAIKSSTSSDREVWIDYIKAIAIIFVIFTHCNWTEEQRKLLFFPFWINLAVPLFMIVTGYNYYNSLKKLGGGYNLKWILGNSMRILFPFIITMLIETILMSIKNYSVKEIIFYVCTGGIGPGSYYTVVILQIIIIYPLIYKVLQSKYGILYIIVANLIFEILVSVTDMNSVLYRLIAFRYLTFLTIGSWYTAHKKIEFEKKLVFFIFLGTLCIYLLNYSGINLLIFKQWTTTSMPTVFLTFGYFCLIKKYFTKKNKIIEIISKSSFHIFLVQMVYYVSLNQILHIYLDMSSELVYFVINAAICISGGIIFFYFEKLISKFLKFI